MFVKPIVVFVEAIVTFFAFLLGPMCISKSVSDQTTHRMKLFLLFETV